MFLAGFLRRDHVKYNEADSDEKTHHADDDPLLDGVMLMEIIADHEGGAGQDKKDAPF